MGSLGCFKVACRLCVCLLSDVEPVQAIAHAVLHDGCCLLKCDLSLLTWLRVWQLRV
jgi:hypothetical protein